VYLNLSILLYYTVLILLYSTLGLVDKGDMGINPENYSKEGRWSKREDETLRSNYGEYRDMDNVSEILATMLLGRDASAVKRRLKQLKLMIPKKRYIDRRRGVG